MSVFTKVDEFGIILLLKLATVIAGLLCALSRTACFVACQTGNLARVFCDARLPKSDRIRYCRLAVIHAVVCWTIAIAEMLLLTVSLFLVQDHWDLSLAPVGVHVFMSDQLFLAIFRLFAGMMYFFAYASWIFTLSVNYIGCTVCSIYRTISGAQAIIYTV